MAKRKHHSPEQISGKLREAEVRLAQGQTVVGQASKAIGVSEQTFYRWRAEYGGMKVDQQRARVRGQSGAELARQAGRGDALHRTRQPSSNPAAPGRTATARASSGSSATSCWSGRSSIPFGRRRSWSSGGAEPTTPSGRIRLWAIDHRRRRPPWSRPPAGPGRPAQLSTGHRSCRCTNPDNSREGVGLGQSTLSGRSGRTLDGALAASTRSLMNYPG